MQNQQKDILQQKNVVAGKNLPYVINLIALIKRKTKLLRIRLMMETKFRALIPRLPLIPQKWFSTKNIPMDITF